MPLYYLAYGSNLHPDRLRQRTLWCALTGQVVLPGYQLRFHKLGRDGSGKATLIPTGSPADQAYGIVYRIPRLAKPALDIAEWGYRTVHLEVAVGARQQEVFTYLAEPALICPGLPPFSWYKDLVVAGARYHRLPPPFVAELLAVASVADPDRDRQQRHLSLLAALTRPSLCTPVG
jgi:gamma-glutamylcyclotransferase